jgi:hypothetical protein
MASLTVDRARLEREVSVARLRVLVLVPFTPAWDAAMGRVEDLERELWHLDGAAKGYPMGRWTESSLEAVPA